MQTTTNYNLKILEGTDPVEIQDFNDNAEMIDKALAKKMEKTSEASQMTTKFSEAETRTNLVNGENLGTSLGKVRKFFADLKSVAFSGKASDLAEDATHRLVTDTEKTSWNGKVNASGGDISDTKVSSFAASTAAYPVPAPGETPKTLWGKVRKFCEDMNNLRASMLFIGSIVNNCVTNNANLPLSAAQGKVLMDLYNVLNTNLSKKADLSSNPSFRSLELFSDIPYIDFHYENSDKDYTSRIYERSPGVIDISAELLQKGKRVIICENDTISFRNESGYLMGRIGSLDLGSIISIAGHRMKFLWNGELQRIYVHMDGAQLGYINLLK